MAHSKPLPIRELAVSTPVSVNECRNPRCGATFAVLRIHPNKKRLGVEYPGGWTAERAKVCPLCVMAINAPPLPPR